MRSPHGPHTRNRALVNACPTRSENTLTRSLDPAHDGDTPALSAQFISKPTVRLKQLPLTSRSGTASCQGRDPDADQSNERLSPSAHHAYCAPGQRRSSRMQTTSTGAPIHQPMRGAVAPPRHAPYRPTAPDSRMVIMASLVWAPVREMHNPTKTVPACS